MDVDFGLTPHHFSSAGTAGVVQGKCMAEVLANAAAIDALPAPATGNKVHRLKGKVEGRDVPSGMAVVVTAKGVKSFFLDYWHGGRQRRFTIGRWPDWSVVRAVREARELRQRIGKGEDPLASKEAVRK